MELGFVSIRSNGTDDMKGEKKNLPSVSHRAGNTLGNENAVTLGEVTSGTSVALLAVLAAATSLLVLHGVDAAHATVRLDQLTLSGHEGRTGRLSCTSQQATHHDSGSAKRKTLDNVANVLNTTIGNARNAESGGKGADSVDRGGLRAADSHNLLGDASGAAAHANSETVDAGSDKRSSLLSSNDVSADDIEVRELGLDPLDHVDLVHAVTLRAVQDNNVKTSIDQLLETDLVLGTSSDGSSADELLAVWKLGSQREVLVLGQVGAGDHGNKVEVLVHDRQLALLGLGEDDVGLGKIDTVGGGDKIGDHDLGDGLVVVILELDVTVGDDTEQL